MKCSLCDSEVHVKKHGLCRAHYLRLKRHGDPLGFSRNFLRGKAHPKYKHGGHGHELFSVYSHMISRCHNASDAAFNNYGGRGITVCQEWRESFSRFVGDMGPRPDGWTIDRINNDIGYSKENCRWADYTTQARNRRLVKLSMESAREIRKMRSEGVCRADIAVKFGVSIAAIKKVIGGHHWKESDAEKPAPALADIVKRK